MKKDKEQYSGFPMEICGTVLAYAEGGWQKVPSTKQTKHLIKYIDGWKLSSEQDDD